ncbi:MAG: hypothetical protein JJE44_09305 [Flavobacteriaceae bacterium]|nr:hypothetical protein [Flavobacteriaceae bacterium]
MKKLENYGVLEINAKEISEINGGLWWFGGLSYTFDVGGIRTYSEGRFPMVVV